MTALLDRSGRTTSRRATGRQPGSGSAPAGKPGSSRSWGQVAVAVLLVAGSALLIAQLYSAKGDRVRVLAVAREVPAGTVIERADLRVVEVDAEGVATISAGSSSSVIGRTATARLLPGMLLTGELVADGPVLSAGDGVLEIQVAQLPAGLAPESPVVVLLTGETPGSVSATVVEIDRSDAPSDGSEVSLRLPRDQAGVVAQAAAAGEVAVLLVGTP